MSTMIETAIDLVAEEIGFLYRKAGESQVESTRFHLECGHRLNAEKSKKEHGEWLKWLENNKETLGFGVATAGRLMKAATNCASTRNFTPEDAVELSREMWGNRSSHRAIGTSDNEWYTPADYIEAARKVMGDIDLDPASHERAQENIRAQHYFTKENNGLEQQWFGRVWLNPPYSRDDLFPFVDKLVRELSNGNVSEAILLTHNFTDTTWFHLAESIAIRMCFTKGRIAFIHATGEEAQPTNGQTFFYFGENADKFDMYFKEFGFLR